MLIICPNGLKMLIFTNKLIYKTLLSQLGTKYILS
jgi:hypothetical protein